MKLFRKLDNIQFIFLKYQLLFIVLVSGASLMAQMTKNPPAMKETRFDLWFEKIPWTSEWQPTPVLLPGKFHRQRNLVDNSPWYHKEPDRTEQLTRFANQQSVPCLIYM